jgi:hypothetical protein
MQLFEKLSMKVLHIIGEAHGSCNERLQPFLELGKQDKIIVIMEGHEFDLQNKYEKHAYGVEDATLACFSGTLVAYQAGFNINTYGKNNPILLSNMRYYAYYASRLFLDEIFRKEEYYDEIHNTIYEAIRASINELFEKDAKNKEIYNEFITNFFTPELRRLFCQNYHTVESEIPQSFIDFFIKEKDFFDHILKNTSRRLLPVLIEKYQDLINNYRLLNDGYLNQFFIEPNSANNKSHLLSLGAADLERRFVLLKSISYQ